MERHVVAHDDPVPHREGQAHGLVVGVSDADCKSAPVKGGFRVEDTEQLHAVAGNRVFFPHCRELPEAQSFDQGSDNLVVRYRLGS